MNKPKVFICIQENDGRAEFVDWVVTNSYEKAKELYIDCVIEELPIELILQDIKELQRRNNGCDKKLI